MSKMYYTKDHEWIQERDGKYYIGITDFAQEQLGDIVFVELPEVDDEFGKDEAFGVVESVKSASDILSPLGMTIVEVNEELEDSPELLNEDAMENWIVAVDLADEAELEELMDESEYQAFSSEEQ